MRQELTSGAHHLARQFIEAARADFFDGEKIREKKPAGVGFVDDVHLQRENVADLINQSAVIAE